MANYGCDEASSSDDDDILWIALFSRGPIFVHFHFKTIRCVMLGVAL